MHNVINKRAPAYLSNFTHVSDIHEHNTRRSSTCIAIPRVGKQGQNTFKYNAVKLWNALPQNMALVSTKDSFKCLSKRFFLSQMETKF